MMARVTKDGIAYNVTNEVQLSAFLNSGWKIAEEEQVTAPVLSESEDEPVEEKPKRKRTVKK